MTRPHPPEHFTAPSVIATYDTTPSQCLIGTDRAAGLPDLLAAWFTPETPARRSSPMMRSIGCSRWRSPGGGTGSTYSYTMFPRVRHTQSDDEERGRPDGLASDISPTGHGRSRHAPGSATINGTAVAYRLRQQPATHEQGRPRRRPPTRTTGRSSVQVNQNGSNHKFAYRR